MTSQTKTVRNLGRVAANMFALGAVLFSVACQGAADNSANARPAATNVAVAKPTEAETKKTEAPAVGKEIKPADGPKLKSIEPVEGTILGGVLNDLAIELPQPDPDAAKAANESGTVTVEVIVNEKGAVTASSVVSGPQDLWRAAGEAARKARFDPPLHNGKPVKVAGILTYDFK